MEQRSKGVCRVGKWWYYAPIVAISCSTGCTMLDSFADPTLTSRASGFGVGAGTSESFADDKATLPKDDIRLTADSAKQEPKELENTPLVGNRPAYAQIDKLPIDLPSVIRMVDSNSPSVNAARAKTREAEARLSQAEVLWLPHLSVGTAYNRFDGQTQNQRGEVFDVSRANLFTGAGGVLTVDVADAIYQPLIERRSFAAAGYRAQAITLGSELEAVLAYLDLVQLHSQIEINRDILDKAEANLTAAKQAQTAKIDRTAGDVNRSTAEVLLRRAERTDLQGRANAAGARLARLLLLPPTVTLLPAEMLVTPITMIAEQSTLDDLVTTALRSRPDLAANREALEAAVARVKRQSYGPFIPKVAVANQTGDFGGGVGNGLRDFGNRNVLSAQIFWELKNFGLGNLGAIDERRAAADEAQFNLLEVEARVAAEIIELAQTAVAKQEALAELEKNVKEATELYRISKEGVLNVADGKNLYDALRPLQAIQLLNQAKQNYLSAIMDYNRAQFRLYVALGRPPIKEESRGVVVNHP